MSLKNNEIQQEVTFKHYNYLEEILNLKKTSRKIEGLVIL